MQDKPELPLSGHYDQPTMSSIPIEGLSRGGRILNRYVVQSELGRGGFGAVYLCHDEVAGIDVALKTIPPELAYNKPEMQRIKDNFQLIESLHHPHIAAIKTIEKDPDSDAYYLIMEYVPGEDLATLLNQNKKGLEPEQVVKIGKQIGSALDYGHEKGILHRDIKPGNIRITPDGSAKLLDYGIADQIHESMSRLTAGKHEISGTGPYMSPEQWRGKTETAAADQYALAVTLYECLAGHPPFKGRDFAVLREIVLKQHAEKPSGLNADQWEALARGLDKEATERYPTCTELAAHLETAFTGAEGSMGRKGKKNVLLPLALAAAAIIGLGTYFFVTSNAIVHPDSVHTYRENTPASAVSGIPNYHALVIGISDYPNGGDGWNDLSTPRNDAMEISEVLANEYGFKVTRLLDKQATRASITAALDGLSQLGPDDACLVYFAGHGYYDDDINEGYWIPSDARSKTDGRAAKEDWIWNSFITKMLDASRAKHILMIADSCYSGSLFRGPDSLDSARELNWYRRALDTPSRYLITSGDLEPVMDGGGKHSFFAKQILNYLRHSAREVFSASDLGQAVREKVSMMTGQLVRSGQIAVSAHAGGEFVFVQNKSKGMLDVTPLPPDPNRQMGSAATRSPQEILTSSVDLHNAGATNSAMQLLQQLNGSASEQLAVNIADYLSKKARAEKADNLRKLIERVEKRTTGDQAEVNEDRPEIITCLGPVSRGSSNEEETLALVLRLSFNTALGSRENLVVVEREAIQEILSELDLGSSSLSEKELQLRVGKLMPASRIILGDLFKMGDKTTVMMRLVDTETTRILKSATETITSADDPMAAADKLVEALLGSS